MWAAACWLLAAECLHALWQFVKSVCRRNYASPGELQCPATQYAVLPCALPSIRWHTHSPHQLLFTPVLSKDKAYGTLCCLGPCLPVQERVSLKDCQVGPSYAVPEGGDYKGEVLAKK